MKAARFRGDAVLDSNPDPTLYGDALSDFQREASLMSKLRHDNIVRLFAIMLRPLRLVMEYCAEGDLRSALRQRRIWGGAVPADPPHVPPLCWKIALDIALAMRFLHSQSPPIAHRDLRSPNVFLVSLDPDSAVCAKVADFGLSVAVTSRQTFALASWQWMAPEAQLGTNYSHLCDVYSCAVVMNELFTQQLPFEEYAALPQCDLLNRLFNEGLRPTIPSFVPGWMSQLLAAMWHGDPSERPSFADCVHRLQNGGQPGPMDTGALTVASAAALRIRIVFENEEGGILCMDGGSASGEVWLGFHNGTLQVFSSKTLQALRREVHSDGKVLSVCSLSEVCTFSGSSDGSVRCWGKAPPPSTATRKFTIRSKRATTAAPSLGLGSVSKGSEQEAEKKSPRLGSASYSSKPSEHASSPRPASPRISSVGLSPRKSVDARASSLVEKKSPRLTDVSITCLLPLLDVVLQGCANGALKVFSQPPAHNDTIERSVPESISSICAIDGHGMAWVAAGCHLYSLSYPLWALEKVVDKAHDQPIAFMEHAGDGQIWTCTALGEVRVWDSRSLRQTSRFVLDGTRIFFLRAVELCGTNTMWIGKPRSSNKPRAGLTPRASRLRGRGARVQLQQKVHPGGLASSPRWGGDLRGGRRC